jgi:hypothetical protein
MRVLLLLLLLSLSYSIGLAQSRREATVQEGNSVSDVLGDPKLERRSQMGIVN